MILVFELADGGIGHAPGNSHWIQVIAAAAPHQQVRVFGAPGHLAALRADPNLTAFANVGFREIALPRVFARQFSIVSPRRFRDEMAILRAALAEVPRHDGTLIVFAQAASTAVFAARLLARLERRRLGVQMVLHGFLNDILGWRARSPLRRFDLRALLAARLEGVRFLALDPAVAEELVREVPEAAGRVDALHLPVNVSELRASAPVPLARPIRVGLVGQTTAAKGIGPFLEIARRFKARYGPAIEFHVVGRRFPDTPPAALDVLARPIPDQLLDRSEFIARIQPLHYVLLPLQASYYRLSPSGALIDAITWLKPVIATDLPIVSAAFQEGGDIGHLCVDSAAMETVLEDIMERPDPDRYARQVEALARLRATRTPEALVPAYRRILAEGFAGLFAESET